MKTVSFTNQPKLSKDKRPQGLSSQFFTTLIKLESDFSNKTYTAETLDELTQYYAQCVEYYDSVHDQISSYFIFKIQDILATKKSLKLLIQEARENNNKSFANEINKPQEISIETSSQQILEEITGDNTPTANSSFNKINGNSASSIKAPEGNPVTIQEESSEDEDDKDFKVKRPNDLPKKKGHRNSIGTMKNKKQKLFSLHLKLQNEKANAKQNLHDVLAAFGGSSQDNDSVVLRDIDVQRKRIQEKLAKKKQASFANYTQNLTGFLGTRGEGFEDKSMESFLKGLDDEEDNIPSQINADKEDKEGFALSEEKENSSEQKQEEAEAKEQKEEEQNLEIEAVVENEETGKEEEAIIEENQANEKVEEVIENKEENIQNEKEVVEEPENKENIQEEQLNVEPQIQESQEAVQQQENSATTQTKSLLEQVEEKGEVNNANNEGENVEVSAE